MRGAGNSTSLLDYVSYDENPLLGLSYYRLKQTDFSGQFSYSKIISIEMDGRNTTPIEIYPNPTSNEIVIIGNTTELNQILIYNVLGQDVTMLTTRISSGDSKLVIDLSKLIRGIYYIKRKTTANMVSKQ